MQKPTYKLSPSMLNAWVYYLENPTAKNLLSIKNKIIGKFETNKYMERGMLFEKEVFEGLHGKLSELVMPLAKQKWCNTVLEFADFNVKLSGKVDVIDNAKKRLYDIKRVGTFEESKYDTSTQHMIYFYLNPEIMDFYYLLGAGNADNNDPKGLTYHVIAKHRPEQEELDKTIMDYINNFVAFLKEKGLWDDFTAFQQTKQNKGAN
jgi:hypothetical protein